MSTPGMWEDETAAGGEASGGVWDAPSSFSLGDEAHKMWNDVTRTVGQVQKTVTPWIDGAVRTVSNGAKDLWSGIAD